MAARFKCNKVKDCKQCGGCCTLKELAILENPQDKFIRQRIYDKTGIIYMYPLSTYTINLSHEEAETLRAAAKELSIKLNIKPKRVAIKEGKLVILDWFIDHEICPFLSEKNICKVYELRPLICKEFPNIRNLSAGKVINYEKIDSDFLIARDKAEKLLAEQSI